VEYHLKVFYLAHIQRQLTLAFYMYILHLETRLLFKEVQLYGETQHKYFVMYLRGIT